ncbi:MAG: SDR family NAD(P)-dependent oxidoreductase [Pseudomonadota bacterium]
MTDQIKLDVPWDRKPEPNEVLGDIDLSGKRAVVTGGYSGIGLETVRALSGRSVEVIVPVRSREKAEAALGGIDRVTVADLDLGDLASVKSFAGTVTSDGKPLDLLINNAGIMACPEARLGHGWESQFATNHIGHFVLTAELLPSILKADRPRVVALSSSANRISGIRWDDPQFTKDPYEKWLAYGQSKTANALFARHLNKREDGLLAFSVHPGGIMTDLQRHLSVEEQVKAGWMDENGELSERAKPLFKTTTQGASTTLWAATSPMLESHGGVFCEDCNISEENDDPDSRFFGVRSWACSDEEAEKLWAYTEELLA